MKAAIISVGDELLIGQVINTNAAFIAEELNKVGIEVERIVTIGDDLESIVQGFNEHYPRFEVVIVTGGLGPTHDDITRTAVCRFFRTDLAPNQEVRENIEKVLKKRNASWSKAADDQVLFPRGASVIRNSFGTAPGELFERDGKYFIVMPGVPYEMEGIMREFVVPYFSSRNSGNVVLHRTLKTTGIPESMLAERLGNIEELLEGAKLAFLPSPLGVRLRITVIGNNRSGSQEQIEAIEEKIRARAGKFIYGTDDEELEEVLGKILKERGLTISVAESCTGGLVANKITNVPGSSAYFERGVITYSNESKIVLLGISREMIKQYGAVSQQVAEAMALGIRRTSGADIGLSTTGIAGPDGGSPEKPVGLVWIGYSDASHSVALKFTVGEGRLRVKERASQAALELVRRKLLKIE